MAFLGHFDDILKVVGQHGRYQIIQVLTLYIVWFPLAYNMLSVVFTGFEPDFRCKAPLNSSITTDDEANETTVLGKCSIRHLTNTSGTLMNKTSYCPNGYEYSQPKYTSFVSEWDLVCENSHLDELSQTLLMCGQTFGATVFASLADKFGRKKIHVTSHICNFILSMVLAFSQNFMMFGTLRFFIGAMLQGSAIPTFVMTMEWFPAEDRTIIGTISSLVWALAMCSLAPLAYIFRNSNWRHLQITIAAISVYSLAEIWILDESPRWLMANAKLEEAIQIIRRAARFNGANIKDVMETVQDRIGVAKPLTNILDDQPEDTTEIDGNKEEGKELVGSMESVGFSKIGENSHEIDELRGGNIFDKIEADITFIGENEKSKISQPKQSESLSAITLLKNKHLRWMSIFLWYTWFVNSLVYYGLLLTTSDLAGSRFVNFFISALMEIPAVVLMWVLLKWFGRIPALIVFHAIAAISLLTAGILLSVGGNSSSVQTALVVVTMVGKLGISGSFDTVWVYTPEIFPTNVRNAGAGIASSLARIGGMIAPFSRYLIKIVNWGPAVIFGSLCFLVCIGFYFMPETGHRELPQTLDDVLMWRKEDKKLKKIRKAKP